MPQHKQRKKELTPFSIRLRPILREALSREAQQQHRSMSNLIETILDEYVDAKLCQNEQEWEIFWTGLHAEARERGLDRLTPKDVLGEVTRHRTEKRHGL